MDSIQGLPTEILDHIFSYLTTEDQKLIRLVCCRWNHLLSSPRYWKTMKLQVEPCRLTKGDTDVLLQAAETGKYKCIEMFDPTPNRRPSQESIQATVKLLEACVSSLDELRLIDCSNSTLRIVSRTLRKMCRLRHLRVDSTVRKLPEVPRTVLESLGLVYVTHLDVCLSNQSCVELVRMLATQLKNLVLRMLDKELVVQCLNEIHLPALLSLAVVNTVDCWMLDSIGTGQLNGECWRTLAQLDTLRITSHSRIMNTALEEILRHCRNVQCLAIEHGTITNEGIEYINDLKGLKNLNLNLWKHYGSDSTDSTVSKPVLQLPNLEHLHLLTEVGIRLDKQLPRLASVIIEGPDIFGCAKDLLSEVMQIRGIRRRRLQKLLLRLVTLDRMDRHAWLNKLSIEELALESCRIDEALLGLIVEAATKRRILRIIFTKCTFFYRYRKRRSKIRTIAGLRARCPYLQISDNGTLYE